MLSLSVWHSLVLPGTDDKSQSPVCITLYVNPTNIASVNLVMGFFSLFQHLPWRTEQPKCRPPSLTTTSVDTESECAPSHTNIGWAAISKRTKAMEQDKLLT